MRYLVQLELADSPPSGSPAERLAFIEQFVLPTLEACKVSEAEGTLAPRRERLRAGARASSTPTTGR